MPDPISAPRRPITLVVAIAYMALAALSLMPAGLSVMAFDAPGSEQNPLTVALVAGLASSPVVFLASSIALLLGYFLRQRLSSILGLWPPFLLVVYVAVVLYFLQTQCAGSFVCGHAP